MISGVCRDGDEDGDDGDGDGTKREREQWNGVRDSVFGIREWASGNERSRTGERFCLDFSARLHKTDSKPTHSIFELQRIQVTMFNKILFCNQKLVQSKTV